MVITKIKFFDNFKSHSNIRKKNQYKEIFEFDKMTKLTWEKFRENLDS